MRIVRMAYETINDMIVSQQIVITNAIISKYYHQYMYVKMKYNIYGK